MKKILITLFVISMLAVSVGFVFAAKPTAVDSQGNEVSWAHNDCTKIQDGTITDVEGNPITLGYDQFGYNYQAHIFNGRYCDYDRVEGGDYCDVGLIMKWSDEWLANTDCNNDSKLDRGYSCDPISAGSSGCPGAWLTNHQSGSYELDGKTCKWTYFVKIVAVPADAYVDEGKWYTADRIEIGEVIWGAFAIIQQVENDPCAGLKGIQYNSPSPVGFGFYKPKLVFVETVTVPSDGSSVTSTNVLESGITYLFEASGTYTYWPTQLPDAGIADAHCSLRPEGSFNAGPGPKWINGDTLTPGWDNYLEVWADGAAIDWIEDCNEYHIYTANYVGSSNQVSFSMPDSSYGDNSGFVTVNIYEQQ